MLKIRDFPCKDLLITGGAGSFGKAATAYILQHYPSVKIRVYSRDEEKHRVMMSEFGTDDHIVYIIGDINNGNKLRRAMRGCQLVWHCAALKQVPACEENIDSFIATNIQGSMEVGEAAIDCGVDRVVFLSSDKACNPVVSYGITKLMAERYFIWANNYSGHTEFICTRYGNVACSTGSVIPLFRSLIASGKRLQLTDLRATRFFMKMDQAIGLILLASIYGTRGDLFIPHLPSFSLRTLVHAMLGDDYENLIDIIGMRGIEKMHEELMTADELKRARVFTGDTLSLDGVYRVPSDTQSTSQIPVLPSYSSGDSGHVKNIAVNEMVELLRHL